jgi:signal transduction histidine kinase
VNVIVAVVGLLLLGLTLAALRGRVSVQAETLVERQTQLEEQATELEEQASELEEQATELEAQTEELQDTVRELGRKNEELNAFSSSVAHDLRSPLRSIDGFSHLLLADYGERLDDAGVSALKRIRVNAQRMGELIDGLLSLARVSGGELRMTDVNLTELASGAADDIRRGLADDRNINVVIQSGLSARGDSRLLRVAVHNLVDNAIKFTRPRTDARVEVGSKLVDGQHAFFVTDNGVGFDMRYANKLFGAFERLHDDPAYEGTGIGLATVRRIVERHGGRLWAESQPGRGATFYFTVAA